ncbi:MAG TPA: LpqB family beta-propeller domain-containing protein [Terriglobia bacterium]|nr:LpqB family beta-propeller domain-containing protein [Terriglobia bacterium]
MLTLVAASRETRVQADSTPNYNSQVAPILQKNCLACHSSASKMGGLVMESYDTLMKGGVHGPAIIPGKTDQSRMILMLEGKVQPRMPFGADPLPAADIATLNAWVEGGARGPARGEATTALAPLAIPDIKPQVAVVSPVASVEFSPDGKLLAVGGYQEVRLIDSASGKPLATLSGHADYVRSIAFSPDGKMLAAAGGPPQRGGEIKIWDVSSVVAPGFSPASAAPSLHSGQALKGGATLLKTLLSHKDCIYSIAWSADGKLLASGSYDKMVKLWDAATGQEVKNLQDHIDAVFAVAFSPDGKHLASGSQDRSVKIWDIASGQRLYTLGDATDGLTSMAYSPSGFQIAAAGYDKTIYVWQVGDSDGRLLRSLIADEDSILALAWTPDGKMLVTSSSDGSIRFRDAATLDPIGVIAHQPDWVEALSLSPDGTRLAAGRFNGTVSLFDVKSLKEVMGPWVAFENSGLGARDTSHGARDTGYGARDPSLGVRDSGIRDSVRLENQF